MQCDCMPLRHPQGPISEWPQYFHDILHNRPLILSCEQWPVYTGKNDLTRRVTHREAVFGPVIHSIFDAWHYEVLWNCELTRLLWYGCVYECLMLYITLDTIYHSAYKSESKLPDAFHCTLPSTLWSTLLIAHNCTLPACFTMRTGLLSMAHSRHAWLYALKYALKTLPSILPSTLSNTLPIALDDTSSLLDFTLTSKLSICSQSHSRVRSQVYLQLHSMTRSQPAWLYAPM